MKFCGEINKLINLFTIVQGMDITVHKPHPFESNESPKGSSSLKSESHKRNINLHISLV